LATGSPLAATGQRLTATIAVAMSQTGDLDITFTDATGTERERSPPRGETPATPSGITSRSDANRNPIMPMKPHPPLLLALLLALGPAFGGENPAPWPSDRQGLVFCLEKIHFTAPAFALDQDGKELLAWKPSERGKARRDRNWGMVLAGGSMVADQTEGHLLATLAAAGALSLEAWITPPADFAGPGEIVSFATDAKTVDFALMQTGKILQLVVRTGATAGPPLNLGAVEGGKACHVAVTYAAGTVIAYVDGKEASKQALAGDFKVWTPAHLVFGDNWEPQRNWPGLLEGVAIFSRALAAGECRADADAFRQKVASRRPPTVIEVKAKLLAKSEVPEPKKILPYRRQLQAYEYEVEAVLSGICAATKIRVAHYGIMDLQRLPVADWAIGSSHDLRLEPFDERENPQLQSEYLRNDLPDGPDVTLYVDTRP
jgi:hypothetical protein